MKVAHLLNHSATGSPSVTRPFEGHLIQSELDVYNHGPHPLYRCLELCLGSSVKKILVTPLEWGMSVGGTSWLRPLSGVCRLVEHPGYAP